MTGIADEQMEQVFEYRLSKGRKYTLTIYYFGGAMLDEDGDPMCALYDLTMSITHEANMV